MNIFERALGRLASMVPGNPAVRLDAGPLCSFTFDDCPRSSMLVGGRLLQQAGVQGTYFVSSSMLDPNGQYGMLQPDDLETLNAHGHEIGCHTFSHRTVRGQGGRELVEEFARNEEHVVGLCGIERLVSFSYPFGEVSFAAKRLVAERFAVARGVREGLNYRLVDMAELRACGVFHQEYSRERMRRLIAECKRKSAWLVFYTHDVTERPSRWGCTPQEFGDVLAAVMDAAIPVYSMRAAAGRVMFRHG